MTDAIDLQPLEPLLEDPDVTEIMVNGLQGVYIYKNGQLVKTDVQFETEEQIVDLVHRIIAPLGRTIHTRSPIVDVRLSDGSRINAVIRPVALFGPTLTISKFLKYDLTWDQLIGFGSVTQQVVDFLRAAVEAKQNIIVAGGTNSGKTTILNALSEFIPHDERVVTAETTAQLFLRHPHVVAMETVPPDPDGNGEITMTDLIMNAQRMFASRIISSEVLGADAWDMLQAMSLGYEGSMFNIHANNVRDTLERLETMSTVATSLPLLSIRAKIAQAVDLIVQQLRLKDGSRKIVSITEVVGFRNNSIELNDIFRFREVGEEGGKIIGKMQLTGEIPTFADQLDLPADFFTT